MAWSTPDDWTTGETPAAAKYNQEIRDNLKAAFPNDVAGVSWTPTLRGTTSGASGMTVTGRRWRVGALQFLWVRYVFPNSGDNTLSGTIFVDLPVAAAGITAANGGGSGSVVGSARLYDSSTSANRQNGLVYVNSSSTVRIAIEGGVASDSQPFIWDTNDVLSFQAVYPIA